MSLASEGILFRVPESAVPFQYRLDDKLSVQHECDRQYAGDGRQINEERAVCRHCPQLSSVLLVT